MFPPGVTTVTSTAPEPAGDRATIVPAESEIIVPALPLPKSTAVAFCRSVPVMVTCVPPDSGPPGGVKAPVATLETAGGGI